MIVRLSRFVLSYYRNWPINWWMNTGANSDWKHLSIAMIKLSDANMPAKEATHHLGIC